MIVNVRAKGPDVALRPGAAGDGVADDTYEIQAALNAAQNGGSVYLPSGRYRITQSLRVYTKTRVYGDGPATEIFCDPQGWLLDNTDHYGLLNIKDADDVEVSGIRFKGTLVAEHTMTPKFIYLERANRVNIHDNQFENSAFEGLWQGGGSSLTTDLIVSRNVFTTVGYPAGVYGALPAIQVNAYNAIISNNILRDVGTGIGASGSKISVVNNRIEGALLVGIGTGDGGPQSEMLIAGNSIFISGGSSMVPVGILIEPVGLLANPVLVSGNLVRVSGVAEFQGPTGIRITKGASASIVGNIVNIVGKGSGIQSLGDIATTSVFMNGNNVHVMDEVASVFAFSAIPNGAGKTVSVISVGNMANGATVAAGSYAIDYNDNGGGTLLFSIRSDYVSGGNVRLDAVTEAVAPGAGHFFDSP